MPTVQTLTPDVSPALEAVGSSERVRSLATVAGGWRAWLSLTKPGITAMVLVTLLAGWFMAGGGALGTLAAALAGTALASGGACALNMWVERESDRRMRRTMSRPIPSGAISPSAAALFGIVLGIAGVGVLALGTHVTAAVLGGATLLTYVGLYTPLKKITPYAFFVGAADGAAGPLLGWCASRGVADAEAWALFAILFVWQFPHFKAIVRMNAGDFARAGFPTFSGSPFPSSLLLVAVSLVPYLLGMSGGVYLAGALLLGLAFTLCAAVPRLQARPLFVASLVYLPALLGLLTLASR
ncbi:MAG: protoheme IX farnesyltransferase [Planctomycetes bacterium]|nr:protoheme IX farnesyltransferase [Planctomycetota bacterium]